MSKWRVKGRDYKPLHITVSPSEADITRLALSDLRAKAYKMAMKLGVFGGSIIFHHLRERKEDDFKESLEAGYAHVELSESKSSWYLSPHFHIIGYAGNIRGDKVAENYRKTGWIVKNLRVRKSVKATAAYQLSHCFVSKGFHTVAWFGALSYRKLKGVPPVPPQEHKCPLCARDLQQVVLVSQELEYIVKSNLSREEILYCDPGLFKYKVVDYG